VPAVLLLHGQPGSPAQWDRVADDLRESGHRVRAPDRPGYGASKLPAGDFAHNARAMVDLLDEAEVDRAVVAGHSWGAGVALAMAHDHVERVAALALVCPVVPGHRTSRRSTVRAMLDGRTAWVEHRALVRGVPDRPVRVPVSIVIAADDDVIDSPTARRYGRTIGAELVEVADAGHLLPMERPAEVARAIASLTSESRGGR
jgi:pimeloyl-ACP methyl ester carboxylesterase